MTWEDAKREIAEEYNRQGWSTFTDPDKFYQNVSKLMIMAFKIDQFPPGQRQIYDVLRDEYLSTGQIAVKVGRKTQNVTTQLQWMMKSGLIDTTRDGKFLYWKRKMIEL